MLTHRRPGRLTARLAAWTFALCLSSPATAMAQAPPEDPQETVCQRLLARAAEDPRLELARAEHGPSKTTFVQGYYTVKEDRDADAGRELRLGVVILPARQPDPEPDPVFLLHGGPGAPATSFLQRQLKGWLREQRDVVLIDQRGTGFSNKLAVPLAGDDSDLQTYFSSYFEVQRYRAALPELQARADLAQYTTPNSVDDFDELRAALGYDKINLRGGSYGTRAALVYLRRHPSSIRSATLIAVQPISYRNPLPHARSAQEALDLIFEEIRGEPAYREAFGDLEEKFQETLARLEESPARVTVTHPSNGEEQTIELGRNAFAEAVRLQLYNLESNRRLPRLLLAAHAGDFRELAEASIVTSRAVRGLIAWGLLMCITGSEDIPRIDPEEIEAACAGTFLGEVRVREQLAVAAFWPSGRVPESFAEPVSSDVPVLLLSGTHDPSTSPAWAEQAAANLGRSLHMVVPGGHGVSGPAIQALEREFLQRGDIDGLDLTAVRALKLPPLVLPAPRGER